MNKIIKDQIDQLKPSATLAINEESNKLKKSGKKVYKFGFGQSPFPIPESIVSALKNNANKNAYLPMQGLEALRSAIANHLNKNNSNDFKSEDIVIGPGTKELMLLMQIAFRGEVLLSAPSWVSYQPQAFIAKNKVHWIQTSSSSNWFPTAEQLENKIRIIKNQNLIFFMNSPNNPSGTVCKNLKEIVADYYQSMNSNQVEKLPEFLSPQVTSWYGEQNPSREWIYRNAKAHRGKYPYSASDIDWDSFKVVQEGNGDYHVSYEMIYKSKSKITDDYKVFDLKLITKWDENYKLKSISEIKN